MNENIKKARPFLLKKEMTLLDVDYNGNPLLGGKIYTKESDLLETKNLSKNKAEENTAYLGFLQKIGIEPESVNDALVSFIRRLSDNPSLAHSAVQEIIQKNISGDASAFIKLIEILQKNGKHWESYVLGRYAHINST